MVDRTRRASLADGSGKDDIRMAMEPRISIVIPAYNEASYLPRSLDAVDNAKARYVRGGQAIEVIVVDNASTDSTGQLAAEHGCRVVGEERRVIAAVRNAGAREARGAVLAFVDADTRIHPETFNAIERALATGKYVAGATGVKLERISLGIAAADLIMGPMVWATRMDTGVVFCRRADYRAIGGYDESLEFAEDVRFLLDLKRLGRPRGQRLVRITSVKAVTSTRKFDEHGEWHYVAMLFRFGYWCLFAPQRMREFARGYWYGNQRGSGEGRLPRARPEKT
jgi:glycosyltransferase involved in cell wall biosynthesis